MHNKKPPSGGFLLPEGLFYLVALQTVGGPADHLFGQFVSRQLEAIHYPGHLRVVEALLDQKVLGGNHVTRVWIDQPCVQLDHCAGCRAVIAHLELTQIAAQVNIRMQRMFVRGDAGR